MFKAWPQITVVLYVAKILHPVLHSRYFFKYNFLAGSKFHTEIMLNSNNFIL